MRRGCKGLQELPVRLANRDVTAPTEPRGRRARQSWSRLWRPGGTGCQRQRARPSRRSSTRRCVGKHARMSTQLSPLHAHETPVRAKRGHSSAPPTPAAATAQARARGLIGSLCVLPSICRRPSPPHREPGAHVRAPPRPLPPAVARASSSSCTPWLVRTGRRARRSRLVMVSRCLHVQALGWARTSAPVSPSRPHCAVSCEPQSVPPLPDAAGAVLAGRDGPHVGSLPCRGGNAAALASPGWVCTQYE